MQLVDISGHIWYTPGVLYYRHDEGARWYRIGESVAFLTLQYRLSRQADNEIAGSK